MCGSICKIILGIVLVLIGLFALVPVGISIYGISSGFTLPYLIVVILGSVPVLIVLFGLLLIWIESEELKTEKMFKKKRK